MKKENSVIINPTLGNVPEKLRSARKIAPGVPDIIFDFAEYMADINEKYPRGQDGLFIPETMLSAIGEAEQNVKEEKIQFGVEIPEVLKGKSEEVSSNMKYFPIIIDVIAEAEFAKKFRELFIFW